MGKSLVDYVQAHERMWGVEKYTGRPALAEILKAPVVAFWIDKNIAGGQKQIISVHQDIEPIRQYLDMLIRRLPVGFPGRRLTLLFVEGEETQIGAKFGFRIVSDKEQG